MLWITIAYILGVIFASWATLAAAQWTGLAMLCGSPFVLLRIPEVKKRIAFRPHAYCFILPFFFFLGAARYQAVQPKADAFHLLFYNDRQYELLVTGWLYEPPDYRDTYTNLKIQAEYIDTGSGDLPVSGLLLVRVPPNVEYEYGERIRARGELKTPPENEDFSYREYLAREGVHSYMSKGSATKLPGEGGSWLWKNIYSLKKKLIHNTYQIFSDPEASLLSGILFGVDTGLTRQLQTAFKDTGTSHIIAISGFNISIIAGMFFFLFKRLTNERLGILLAIAGVIFYTLLVGADAAVVRAALMGIASLLARLIGRRNSGLNGLAAAVFFMSFFINPLYIWDVGFQLSAFATLGLILYAEPFSAFTANILSRFIREESGGIIRFINENVMLTFAAQLTTIPIMAYHFKRISLVSFIVNPLILPVQPIVMIFSGMAVFISLLIFPLGQLLAWLAWPFPAYTIRMVELFEKVPHGVLILGKVPFWSVALFYAALLGLTFNWSVLRERFNALGSHLRTLGLTASIGFLFICAILLFSGAANSGDGQLHITFLDVGSSNAVLIQTPEGRNILINGGESASGLSDELGRRLPWYSRKLDWLIIASADENDLSALPRVVERYKPDHVLWSGNIQGSFSAQTLDKYFAQEGIPVTRAEAGQKLELGETSFIEIQASGPRGGVIFIQYGNFRALLPVGLNDGYYESIEYGNTLGPLDVLLLADSGYAPANPPDLLENTTPRLVVLSVAAGDPDGLPSREVLEQLDGYSLLRTDRNGWISVITDGLEMRVQAERNSE